MAALRASTPHMGSLSAPTVADLDTQNASAAGSLMSDNTRHSFALAGKSATALLPCVTHVVFEMQTADGKGIDRVTDTRTG